jgi:hypothetical protein
MEIIQIKDCKISLYEINSKYTEWFNFHLNYNIIDINNIVNKRKEIEDVNDFEEIYCNTLSKYCICNCIIYNNKLVGIYLIDEAFLDIRNLILANDCDWFQIINLILKYYKQLNKDIIHIDLSFNNIMDTHIIIDEIITFLKGIILYDKNDRRKYYNISLIYLDYKFNNKLIIEIIGYKDCSKNKELFNYKTNIAIFKREINGSLCSWCYMPKRFIKKDKILNDIFNYEKHKFTKLEIFFENRLIITYPDNDCYIDINIIYDDIKYNLKIKNNDDLRLNKICEYNYHNYHNYHNDLKTIYSLRAFNYKCICKKCSKHDDMHMINYFNTCSEFEIYNFIEKHFSYLIKSEEIDLKSYNIDTKKFKLDLLSCMNKTSENTVINVPDTIVPDTIVPDTNVCSYIYLIEKYDVNENHPIFKFGKTNRLINKRLKEHGKEAKQLIILHVNNCNFIENKILSLLKQDKNIKHLKNIGNEYFYCDNKDYLIKTIITNIY